MKKVFVILAAVLFTASVFAQSPQKLSYQTVIRTSTNQLVSNQGIGMRVSILQTTENGTAVYVEKQTVTTNLNGLASVEIGAGTVVSGVFASIDWSAGPYFIKTETDPTALDGTAYSITGTSKLMSVPYALYSVKSTSASNGIAPGTATGDMNYWNGSAWVRIPVGTPGQVLTLSANKVPTWSGN